MLKPHFAKEDEHGYAMVQDDHMELSDSEGSDLDQEKK